MANRTGRGQITFIDVSDGSPGSSVLVVYANSADASTNTQSLSPGGGVDPGFTTISFNDFVNEAAWGAVGDTIYIVVGSTYTPTPYTANVNLLTFL